MRQKDAVEYGLQRLISVCFFSSGGDDDGGGGRDDDRR
jgi:hypothetical protein